MGGGRGGGGGRRWRRTTTLPTSTSETVESSTSPKELVMENAETAAERSPGRVGGGLGPLGG
jgi:hypothetical protein